MAVNKLMLASALLAGGGLALSASPSFSAKARHPYQNVDHRNDRGNNTGIAGTARLNDEQLASIRGGTTMGSGMASGQPDLGTDQKILGGQR